MLSLVEVKCPHCGARGQVMLPTPGTMVVGPCPRCSELVVIFCETAFPLNKEIVLEGTREERIDHVMDVLNVFLHKRVQSLVDQIEEHAEELANMANEMAACDDDFEEPLDFGEFPRDEAISSIEVELFLTNDLPMIDDKDYFHAVFDEE